MKQTYDTDSILFGLLKGSSAITSVITGGIYAGERPLNSVKEDIVVNTIVLSQENEPQIGTSNINVHVPDKVVKIDEVQQKMEDRARIKTLAGLVLEAIRSAKVPGLSLSIESQITISEVEINQHYSNIRVNWTIH